MPLDEKDRPAGVRTLVAVHGRRVVPPRGGAPPPPSPGRVRRDDSDAAHRGRDRHRPPLGAVPDPARRAEPRTPHGIPRRHCQVHQAHTRLAQRERHGHRHPPGRFQGCDRETSQGRRPGSRERQPGGCASGVGARQRHRSHHESRAAASPVLGRREQGDGNRRRHGRRSPGRDARGGRSRKLPDLGDRRTSAEVQGERVGRTAVG
mmetsp:Transcript_30759/g.69494  ORF Transcript_30759/g.69494 Transcript_30759/m.69494 type:complete len:206 (+) Transcript_30759:200-817(+)